MKKYIEIFKYSLKQKINFLPDYIFSLISFGIHVFIFNELWDYILQGKNIEGYTKSELIWYIIIAELVTYSIYNTYKQIADTVKSGEIANILLKPINYIGYLIADSTATVIKLIINIFFAWILGTILAGPIDITVLNVVITLVSIIVGVFLGILIQIFIGLLSFYTEENKSFWLVIQKLQLLLVFTPLEFYPGIVQKILYVLPTTHMIFEPAKIFVHFTNINVIQFIATQLLSVVVMILIIILLFISQRPQIKFEIPYSLNNTISNSASSAFDIFIYFNILIKAEREMKNRTNYKYCRGRSCACPKLCLAKIKQI